MSKTKIVIAEDNPALLKALRLQLETHGFEVVPCADAYTALARAQDVRPNIMVLDIRMPAGNGFDVLVRMRKLAHLREIPVIYVTGESAADLEWKASRLGAFGLLRKPCRIEDLLAMIDAALQNAAAPQAKRSAVFDISDAKNPYANGSGV